jgi:hypothetical protein
MFYTFDFEVSGLSGLGGLMIYEVPDDKRPPEWANRETPPTEAEVEDVATVVTWVYPGGRVTQARWAGTPRWRELAP